MSDDCGELWILNKHAWWMVDVHCSIFVDSEGGGLGILCNFARGHPCAPDHWKGLAGGCGATLFCPGGISVAHRRRETPVHKGFFCRCGDLSATCEDLKFFVSFKTFDSDISDLPATKLHKECDLF